MGTTALAILEAYDDALSDGRSVILPVMEPATNLQSGGDPADLNALLQAISRHDREAFEAFYDATSSRVLNLVTRIVRQHEVAEEVVGDVYLQVWRQADRFDEARGNAIAWLMTISRSRALDALRGISALPTSDAAPMSEVSEADDSDSMQDLLIAVEDRSALHTALEQLDVGQRQLLALAYFRGFTHSQLSGFTGQPLGTIKTQIRRALMKLEKLMQELEPGSGEFA